MYYCLHVMRISPCFWRLPWRNFDWLLQRWVKNMTIKVLMKLLMCFFILAFRYGDVAIKLCVYLMFLKWNGFYVLPHKLPPVRSYIMYPTGRFECKYGWYCRYVLLLWYCNVCIPAQNRNVYGLSRVWWIERYLNFPLGIRISAYINVYSIS